VKLTRLFLLAEAYVEGNLDDEGRAELAAAVAADPMVKLRFVEQVLLARRLRATLRPREGDTWTKIATRLGPEGVEQGRQLANRVDAKIDEIDQIDQRVRKRPSVVWALTGLVAAAAMFAFVVIRAHRKPAVARSNGASSAPLANRVPIPPLANPPGPEVAPVVLPPLTPSSSPPAEPPAPIVAAVPAHPTPPVAPAPTGPRGRMVAEMEASDEPVLARRTDVVQYLGFERPFRGVMTGKLRPRFAGLGPGLTGNGLRVAFTGNRVGLAGGGVRAFVATAAQTTSDPPPQELHLRYYVRLGADFDFGGGGVLPGLCVGHCVPARRPRGAEGVMVRPHWTPLGEIVFQPLPGTVGRDRRWKRFLETDRWVVVEIHVKLNTPGASDGVVEGWLGGDKVVSLGGLRLRNDAATHVEGVMFEAAYKGRKRGAPAREAEMTFDDVAVASGYIGPRQAGP
jgi:hypothetical protein